MPASIVGRERLTPGGGDHTPSRRADASLYAISAALITDARTDREGAARRQGDRGGRCDQDHGRRADQPRTSLALEGLDEQTGIAERPEFGNCSVGRAAVWQQRHRRASPGLEKSQRSFARLGEKIIVDEKTIIIKMRRGFCWARMSPSSAPHRSRK